MNRAFDPPAPDRLWVMDVTEHPTGEGKVYLAVVLDAFSRRVVGWSIADHIRAELVVDAVQMALWRRRPPEGRTVAHSDHGCQTRPGRSAAGYAAQACSARWAPSATASTTAWPRASSAPCSSSCSTSTAGPHANNSPWRSSTGSKPGTTRAVGTPTARCSAPSTTKPPTPPPPSRQITTPNQSARPGEAHSAPYLRDVPIRRIDFSDADDRRAHDDIVTTVQTLEALIPPTKKAGGHELIVRSRAVADHERHLSSLVVQLYGLTDHDLTTAGL